MLGPLRAARRRPSFGPQHVCAGAALLLLLLSVSVLHSRLGSSSLSGLPDPKPSLFSSDVDPLFADEDSDAGSSDPIDGGDVDDDDDGGREEIIRAVGAGDNDDEETSKNPRPGLVWDPLFATFRRPFDKRSTVDDEEDTQVDRAAVVFSSDDRPVDEEIRSKLDSIKSIEDALLLKPTRKGRGASPLRDGWAPWFESRGEFLKKDKMFRLNLDVLDPLKHPLLQDPDGGGPVTEGDRLIKKAIFKSLEKTPMGKIGGDEKVKKVERRTLGHSYAGGGRWGYFPGLEGNLGFSKFVERFFGGNQCRVQVFMVWNSPPWMFGVRHQRGLESLLHTHRDACVLVMSETIELDFFKGFVKDGFKVAVAMPNLDELLKDTPVHVFASVWHEWRKTKHYPVHYSELIRLASLYKYGGVYLDADVIVLKSLHISKNYIGMEDQLSEAPILNGAVMAFEKNSSFILECLKEFYDTYDDVRVRWNGADLLTRVHKRLDHMGKKSQLKLIVEPSYAFFPINSDNITRYFTAPGDDAERAQQDLLFKKILNESTAFHFWNSQTYSLVPETDSLVERLLNHHCLRCLDIL
ncbi:Uncharacterized protein QJS10_CPB11g01672 [Acorus calamus]|uniref:Alpha 1,4-glycosyltransferase domain-containing protein n=1 Tax=Acorus calamus TaxID=4465 RepID=A0AAV9DXH7_ACOCL|nr:Uncharacterized protein QJS10_CPB11g01672 [Acorus calamus]